MKIQYESASPSPGGVVVRRALTAWLAAAGGESFLSSGPLAQLETIAALSPMRMTVMAALFFAAQFAIPARMIRRERWLMVLAYVMTGSCLFTSFNWLFLSGWLLILGILVGYAIRGWSPLPAVPRLRRSFNWAMPQVRVNSSSKIRRRRAMYRSSHSPGK